MHSIRPSGFNGTTKMNWGNFGDQLVAKHVLETRDENSMMSEMKQMILIHPDDGSQAGIDVHNTSCITVTMAIARRWFWAESRTPEPSRSRDSGNTDKTCRAGSWDVSIDREHDEPWRVEKVGKVMGFIAFKRDEVEGKKHRAAGRDKDG
ncbi:hypothetical protein CVT26_007517 [Gymnopilus dilepis]|uniref:Uncharacterized protein n=1 Tax=Gymnopilus dilepis TaxID=231916 RepID=A0A409WHX7_9AGAR|nr:hypothetical protein CVT26_007517 [Gymnopilus dilepis]